jgi:hypothetical protein
MFRAGIALGIAALAAVSPLMAQHAGSTWQPIATDGVLRASAIVDSVFVDRQLRQATVDGGDFTAYLMARLGIRALPPDFGYQVLVDSATIRIGGRIADLPAEAQRALAQLVLVLPPATRLEAQVILLPAGREAVRFHLNGATVQGIPVPDAVLQSIMTGVGRQYPALTETGRDLFVQVPPGGTMTLVPGGVRLIGP